MVRSIHDFDSLLDHHQDDQDEGPPLRRITNKTITLTAGSSSSRSSKVLFTVVVLTLLVCCYVFTENTAVSSPDSEPTTVEFVSYDASSSSPHANSFGGINNVAHPAGAKAAAAGQGLAFQDIIIPTSNVGHAIRSLSRANLVDHWGHYVHDEHRSPYASHLYDQPQEFLEQQQAKYLQKMQAVREEWGAWNFSDPADGVVDRPMADFNSVPHKDLPLDQLPAGAWQTDEKYTFAFIAEARALVTRMKEGIYAEYGHPLKKNDGTLLSEDEQMLREQDFAIHLLGPDDKPNDAKFQGGIAQLSQVAFDGLVRKLLHAMLTHDEFYVVLGGHSAAAGHGNDFHQNRVITFQKIMQPVLDKLGVRLVSRNMAMGGVGTLHFTLAGGDLYGEADIIEWDSGMTEKGPAVDFFNKQAILSGERVPLIMSEFHFDVMEETKGKAWMGMYTKNSMKIMPESTYENAQTLPYATRWIKTQKEEKFNAICWENRTDFTPPLKQDEHPGSQVSWHPGFRFHQWQGRKLALIVLKGLSAALDKWEEGIKADGFPLAESYWHVGEKYSEIRQALRTHINTPKTSADGDTSVEDVRSACEKLIPWIPRICRVQMHGFGMWRPRVHPDYDFLNLVHPAPNGYKPYYPGDNLYHGFDLLPLNQAVPDGEVDVHAIAIATTSPAPMLDHSWTEDTDNTNPDDDKSTDAMSAAAATNAEPPTRRWLREASEQAFKRGSAEDVESGDAGTALSTTQDSHSHVRRQLPESINATTTTTTTTTATTPTAIVPGRGWEVHGAHKNKAFCDGSAQSECGRSTVNKCLAMGANDGHLDLHGNSLSGWLVFTVPKVKEGIIMVRMEWWCGRDPTLITQGWTEVNDGKETDTTPWEPPTEEGGQGRRNLWNRPTHDELVPKDFEMDYAVNGVIKTMKREEWLTYTVEYIKNVAVWPILNDESMAQKDWEGESMEVAIRFRSKEKPQASFCISHVYYA